MLKKIQVSEVKAFRSPSLDQQTIQVVSKIVEDVKSGGMLALRTYAEKLDGLEKGQKLRVSKAELAEAFNALPQDQQSLLQRTAERIRSFAQSQREAISDVEVYIPGGKAGHRVSAVERAACYAPGGRFPLPSSVLMTAISARVAGVKEVYVASPRPTQVTLAAAHVAGADALFAIGGAQAIAALAYGIEGEIPACNIIVGPGNRYVTAAKKLVSGDVAIDMLAGPSELLVLVDETSNLELVAADLLAQAEHDVDAVPIVVSLSDAIYQPLCAEIERQLETLPTADTAKEALKNGFFVPASSRKEALMLCNFIAPEHLQVMCRDPKSYVPELKNFGGLFIGEKTAEVFGDYGAGPNHVLPTAGTACYTAGLSVANFLRLQTWVEISDSAAARELVEDAEALAKLEGLEGHARAATLRNK